MFSLFEIEQWFWSGWVDKDQDANFHNVNDQVEILENQMFQPWKMGEPNGYELEKCAAVTISSMGNLWTDKMCGEKTCSFCDIPESQAFILRGITTVQNIFLLA